MLTALELIFKNYRREWCAWEVGKDGKFVSVLIDVRAVRQFIDFNFYDLCAHINAPG